VLRLLVGDDGGGQGQGGAGESQLKRAPAPITTADVARMQGVHRTTAWRKLRRIELQADPGTVKRNGPRQKLTTTHDALAEFQAKQDAEAQEQIDRLSNAVARLAADMKEHAQRMDALAVQVQQLRWEMRSAAACPRK
jgi:hypothetical protein